MYDREPDINAFEELIRERIVLQDIVALRMNFNAPIDKTITYKKGVDSLSELKDKLKSIDYFNQTGDSAMFGIILMSDGSFWERIEYDGYTYWEHHVVPTVEQVLNYTRND